MGNVAHQSNKPKTVIGIIVVILLLGLGTFVSVLAMRSNAATKKLTAFVEVCATGDTFAMEEFAPSVYGSLTEDTRQILEDTGLSQFVASEESTLSDNTQSVQSLVLSNTTIESNWVFAIGSEATAEITVTSPNMLECMRNIYTLSLMDGAEAYTTESLYAEIASYVENPSDTVTHEIQLPMRYINHEWHIDYGDSEILDQMTGGLISAYKELYSQAVENLLAYFKEEG